VQNQMGGRRVESIVLCGQGQPYSELARKIKEDLGAPAELFDPFEGLEVGKALRDAPPEHPGRFASLLGMVTAELEQTGHAIDFLHPRRPPAPPSRRRVFIAAGVAAAALLLAWVIYARIDHYLLVREVQQLKDEAASLKTPTDDAEKTRAASADIAKWAEHDVVWLDQLRDLSQDFVPAERGMLRQLILKPGQSGGGEMVLKGLVKDSDSIATMGKRLRTTSREFVQHSSKPDASMKAYTLEFDASVNVGRKPKTP
jgi:hypothetical protein